MTSLAELAWPLNLAPEAFEALALETGLPLGREPLPPLPDLTAAESRSNVKLIDQQLEGWLRAAAQARRLSVEGTTPTFKDLPDFLYKGGPALLLVFGADRLYLLALAGRQGKRVRLLLPAQRAQLLRIDAVRDLIESDWQKAMHDRTRFLEGVSLNDKNQESLRQAFLNDLLAPQEVGYGWLLQMPLSASLGLQLRQARLRGSLALLVSTALLSSLLALVAWYTLGQGALDGRVDRGRVWAWCLVLLLAVPLGGLTNYAQGQFALRLSLLVRRILLQGCMNLSLDEARSAGVGRQLALINESTSVEQFASGSVFAILPAMANLAAAMGLFFVVPATRWLAALLVLWVGLLLLAVWSFYRRRLRWTDQRLLLTDQFVAKMAGHRTRRIQQSSDYWHQGEDEAVADYWDVSRSSDAAAVRLQLLPRSWLLAGVLALQPALFEAAPSLLSAMVGLLLAFQALQMLLQGLLPLVNLRLSLRLLREPLQVAQQVDTRPVTYLPPRTRAATGPVIELFDIVFRYRTHTTPVLQGCNLTISPGARLLFEGPSGGGKSTLAALVAGLRAPDSGLILVADFDQHSLNREAWRRVVATAPQFHDNHIFANSLSFNLLMGRSWPASAEDTEAALALCEELGLGALLTRMPNGLAQLVGEMGWQLSHGEKSRIFIARTLLQKADLLVLDESFGALDPETLEICMAAVLRHAKTLVVIAHPLPLSTHVQRTRAPRQRRPRLALRTAGNPASDLLR